MTTNPIPLKAALNMLGHDVGGLRLPAGRGDRHPAGRVPRRARDRRRAAGTAAYA